MKSLLIKDLYNISHNSKSMAFVLLFLAAVLIPSTDVEGYIVASALLCSMMTITTFIFDEASGWDKYALITPVSRRDIVGSKFLSLFLFSGIGVLSGLVLGAIVGAVTGKLTLDGEGLVGLLFISLVALVIAMVVGGMSIPLVFRFGAERGRLMLMVSTVTPALLFTAIWWVLTKLGVVWSDGLLTVLLCLSPIAALLWDGVMYLISCRIYEKAEV